MGRGILGNAIARIFRLDDINAISSVAPEVMPTVSLWERPEFWALAAGSLCVARCESIGGAVFQKAILLNPAGSGVLTIVERIHCPTGSSIYYGLRSGGLGGYTQSSVWHRDTRRIWGGQLGSGISTQFATIEGVTSGIADGMIAAEGEFNLDYVLSPGWGLHFQGLSETDLFFTLLFRERSADAGEINVL